MRPIDWFVLIATLLSIVSYGVWKGRQQKKLAGYLLADRQLHWPTIALSIMATQASAITFLSTPGQAYTDGMRFVQFYIGLPIAMVILAITAVPIYHRLQVYTAYEYLEGRFDARTRVLTAGLFLIHRGLSTGITLFAPSLIVSVILGWNIHVTNILIGIAVIVYTASGGTKAVSWTHMHQLLMALGGMAVALVIAFRSLPADVTFNEAVRVAGALERIKVIDFTFDLTTPYNFWSGLIGGLIIALAYFGTDQSQVQRYLTGETVTESRLGLLFNGLVKVPMQFFILFVGAMVFVFYQFTAPPLFFNTPEETRIRASAHGDEYRALETTHRKIHDTKAVEVRKLLTAERSGDQGGVQAATRELREIQKQERQTRSAAFKLIKTNNPKADNDDTNYVFLTFVLTHFPPGLVGLLLAAIFCAAMSATASGLNSLASSTVVDVYKRFIRREATDEQYVRAGKLITVFWGVFCIGFAEWANQLGSLIVAVNRLGSLVYGTMLAVFLLAFYFPRVGARAAFYGGLIAESAVIYCWLFTKMAWLWWNVVGCAVGIGAAILIQTVWGNGDAAVAPNDPKG